MELSVIIPCYNKAEYIKACLSSILTQDFNSFEVVMINDGSTDETGDICNKIAATDSRVKVFHRPNGGVTAARRYGIEQSQGKYIMFVDCDDQLLPNAMKTLYDTIQETKADEVIGTFMTQKGKIMDSGLRGWQDTDYLIRNLLVLHNSFCVLWAIIFRRKLLDNCLMMSRDIISGEDILMQIKCLMKKPKVFFIGHQVYLYNVGLPNERNIQLNNVKAFDEELEKTLKPRWEEFEKGFLHHCIKTYENYVYRHRQEITDYYKPLRGKDLRGIPIQDRIAFLLPPQIAYYLIKLRKALL